MQQEEESQQNRFTSAILDFRQARQKAAMERFLGSLTGRSTELLPYDEVRKHLQPLESAKRKLEDIPLAAIVGSVNRYTDFSRSFLPRQESDMNRWARVRAAVENMAGLPPIEVYQVGEVYFVLDGHHRVSVARQLGAQLIQAYVTPVTTRVPLSPGDKPDDLILKAEYVDFLTQTRIDELRPGVNLLLTAPGQYPKLLEHISAHRYLMGVEEKREVPYEQAVIHWYDKVFQPIKHMIMERNLLRDFPGRTETDLYLWIMEHRSALGGHEMGWEVSAETAMEYLRRHFGQSTEQRVPRVIHKLQNWLIPDPLEPGPETGAWRREHFSHPHRDNRLFDDILVAVPGGRGWPAVELAIAFARREEARLTGLHVLSDPDDENSEMVQALQADFAHRCAKAGVAGRLLVETGTAARIMYERSVWMDLLVFRLDYPPPSSNKPLARLRSGTRALIRRSSAPLLAVPDAPIQLNSALLAYGGGRKADEALFLATSLAGRWGLPLTVISVNKPNGQGPSPIFRAQQYLEEHGIQANYVQETGDPARIVSLVSEAKQCDLVIMGGYEGGLLHESIRGSTVDRVLRTIHRPVLICL